MCFFNAWRLAQTFEQIKQQYFLHFVHCAETVVAPCVF